MTDPQHAVAPLPVEPLQPEDYERAARAEGWTVDGGMFVHHNLHTVAEASPLDPEGWEMLCREQGIHATDAPAMVPQPVQQQQANARGPAPKLQIRETGPDAVIETTEGVYVGAVYDPAEGRRIVAAANAHEAALTLAEAALRVTTGNPAKRIGFAKRVERLRLARAAFRTCLNLPEGEV